MSIFTRILRRSPPPLTRQEESWIALAADVSRRKILVGDPYRARREAALKATRQTNPNL